MAATIVLRQHTKDFTEWKRVFDANENLRIKGGCLSTVVYRDPADPTCVVVMNHMKDLASAKRYVKSPELIEAMYSARVVAAPSIVILEKVDEQRY